MTYIKLLARRMRAKCKVCKRAFITEKRLRVRQTCSEECRVRRIVSHQNAQRNNSGRFVDDDGEQGPNDPSPDEIQVMAQEIKRRNLELKRLGIETRRD
jgi:hypothetical protein